MTNFYRNDLLKQLRTVFEALPVVKTLSRHTVLVENVDFVEQNDNWSCGYQTIRMISSHLIQTSPYKLVLLFEKMSRLPTLQHIQRAIENAWGGRGPDGHVLSDKFDPSGAKHFQYKLQGTKQWIGTSEACVFFRYFGIRAKIVSFFGSRHDALFEVWPMSFYCCY